MLITDAILRAIRYVYVFFFQAEDGIRDADVTGVQTCALPICFPLGAAFGGFLAAWMIPHFGWRSVLILGDRKSTRLNSSHVRISYAVFCLKKKKKSVIKQDVLHQTEKAVLCKPQSP